MSSVLQKKMKDHCWFEQGSIEMVVLTGILAGSMPQK